MRMTGSRNHDWLSLVTVSGLVVSDPVLAEAFPEGPEHVSPANHRAFIREWERYQQCLQEQRRRTARWLRFIAEDLLGLSAEHWLRHRTSRERHVPTRQYKQVLRPSWVLLGPDGSTPAGVHRSARTEFGPQGRPFRQLARQSRRDA